MKRIIIIAAMALMSVSAFAQKFAYVDFNELVMLVPEMDEARATLEENSKTNEEILMSMYEEYQTKMQQYEQKAATWTQSVREIKEKEIMEIQARLEQTQQSLQQELQQLQQQLQAPVKVLCAGEIVGGHVIAGESIGDRTQSGKFRGNIPSVRHIEELMFQIMGDARRYMMFLPLE